MKSVNKIEITVDKTLHGALVADIARFLIGGAVVFTVGAIMGYRPEAGILAVVASILFMTLIA
jgi:ABC-2 type transport system permease protein